MGVAQDCLEDVETAGDPEDNATHQRHGPAVVRVQDRPAIQSEHHDGHQRIEADQTDGEGGSGQLIDLQGNRRGGQLGADTGGDHADVEVAVRTRLPQRGDVEQDAAHRHMLSPVQSVARRGSLRHTGDGGMP